MDTQENLEAVVNREPEAQEAAAVAPIASAAKATTEVASEGAEVKNTKEKRTRKDKDAAMAAAIAAQQAITGTHQEHIQEALEMLYTRFPKAFIKEGDCKPLKVGILDDLKPKIEEINGLSVSKVRAAVRFYTSRLRYFYAMREGAMRVDLDGNEVEPVSSEHAAYARTRFAEINAKRRPAKPKRAPRGKGPHGRGEGAAAAGQNGQNAQGAPNGEQGQRNGGFNNHRRPNRNFGQGQGQGGGQNNRRNGPARHYEPAKLTDLKVGRFVSVKWNRSFMRATVVEEPRGDKVKLSVNNGASSLVASIDTVYVSVAGRPEGGKRPFDRNRNNNNRNRGPRFAPRNNAEGNGAATSAAHGAATGFAPAVNASHNASNAGTGHSSAGGTGNTGNTGSSSTSNS